MQTIIQSSIKEIIVNKSRFIAYLLPLKDEGKLAKTFLDELRKEHPKARHVCYAIVSENETRSSDDGEPSGTAGRPLLELLHHYQLVNVLLAVVRYFGGSKLGAGRLLRTYVEAGKTAIESANIYQVVEGYTYTISLPYADYENLKRNLSIWSAEVTAISYNNLVTVTLTSVDDIFDQLVNLSQGKAQISERGRTTLLRQMP